MDKERQSEFIYWRTRIIKIGHPALVECKRNSGTYRGSGFEFSQLFIFRNRSLDCRKVTTSKSMPTNHAPENGSSMAGDQRAVKRCRGVLRNRAADARRAQGSAPGRRTRWLPVLRFMHQRVRADRRLRGFVPAHIGPHGHCRRRRPIGQRPNPHGIGNRSN